MFGQDVYEKYNNIQNRYEYFNSNHQMVGYKVYNSIQERWEYHSVEKNQRKRRNSYSSEPVSTFDAGLAYKVLASKQASYDKNVADVRRHLEKLQDQFEQYGNYKKEQKALNMYSEVIEAFNNNNNTVDFSSRSVTVDVMNYFTREYNRIIKRVNNMSTKTTTNNSSYSNNSNTNRRTNNTVFETGFISVNTDISLRAKPNVMSRVVYKCPKDAVVKVVDTSNETYYEVIVDGYSGYISSALLKRK